MDRIRNPGGQAKGIGPADMVHKIMHRMWGLEPDTYLVRKSGTSSETHKKRSGPHGNQKSRYLGKQSCGKISSASKWSNSWNSIPADLKAVAKTKTFKSLYKKLRATYLLRCSTPNGTQTEENLRARTSRRQHSTRGSTWAMWNYILQLQHLVIKESPVFRMTKSHIKNGIAPWKMAKNKNGSREPLFKSCGIPHRYRVPSRCVRYLPIIPPSRAFY